MTTLSLHEALKISKHNFKVNIWFNLDEKIMFKRHIIWYLIGYPRIKLENRREQYVTYIMVSFKIINIISLHIFELYGRAKTAILK